MVQGRPKRSHEVGGNGGLTALHRTRLVPWSVAAVTALAACPDGAVLAVGYEDGKVELWDIDHYSCFCRIPGEDGVELSSLAWVYDALEGRWRLFAGRLNGAVVEVEPSKLRAGPATDSAGGAVWCLAAEPAQAVQPGFPHHLAAACDDGSVRLFAVEGGERGATYARTLATAEGRALSVAWHPQARVLVSGSSAGCIHCWAVGTGHELLRITAGAISASPPCVWALAVLADGTLASADSSGATQFWEGAHGTLLARYERHSADVLALAASTDGLAVFAAGVEPRVALFQRVSGAAVAAARGRTWVCVDAKQPHTHDVRALALVPRLPAEGGPLLASGGNDGTVVLYSVDRFTKEHPVRLSRAPQPPIVALSQGAAPGRLVSVEQHCLDVWQLGVASMRPTSAQGEAADEGDPLDLAAPPRHLAQLRTASPLHLACAAISHNGSLLACSDARQLRAFRLLHDGGPGSAGNAAAGIVVQRVRLPGGLEPAACLAFGPVPGGADDSAMLYSASCDGAITALAFRPDGSAEVVARTDSMARQHSAGTGGEPDASAVGANAWTPLMPCIAHLAVSPDGCWLAVASSTASSSGDAGSGGVQLFALPSLQAEGPVLAMHEGWAERCLDHAPGGGPTAGLAFTSDSSVLVVATAGGSVAAYSVATRGPLPWSREHGAALSELLAKLPGSITGIAADPAPQSRAMVVYTPGGLCHIDASLPIEAPAAKQRRRRGAHKPREAALAHSSRGSNARLLLLEHPALHFGYSAPGSAVLVEKPWADVLAVLPPPLHRHRYGT